MPSYILLDGDITNLKISAGSIFVLLLLAIVVLGFILMLFGVNKNITSEEMDEKIKNEYQKTYRPILNKISWVIFVLVMVFSAYTVIDLMKTHNKKFNIDSGAIAPPPVI